MRVQIPASHIKMTASQVEFDVTPEMLGQWFADLDDDCQCRVFVAAAEVSRRWGGAWRTQYLAAGAHLVDCDCATDAARELVLAIAAGLITRQYREDDKSVTTSGAKKK